MCRSQLQCPLWPPRCLRAPTPRTVTVPGAKYPTRLSRRVGRVATRSNASATTVRATPPKPKAKEDIRVLVTLAEGAPRPEPYLLRHKLVTMLKGSPSDIQHVRRTPAGYAIQPATKLVRDRLVADDLKKELGCAFDASKVSLPEKWFTYAIQDVPFSLKLGPAEYTSTGDLIEEEVYVQTGQKPTRKRDRDGSAPTHVPPSAEVEMTDAPSQGSSSLSQSRFAVLSEDEARRRGRRHRRAEPRDLQVAWANVGKGFAQHITLLQSSFVNGVDVVQVQEPWVMYPTKTQNHPGYESYAPVDAWVGEETRPRVMTYIRKGNRPAYHLSVVQRRSLGSRDLLWLDINGHAMMNCYRQPQLNTVLDYITALDPPRGCIIGGDFNAKDRTFEPTIQHSRDGGSRLASWSRDTGMAFLNSPGVPTHRDGHVLDLTFSNIPFASTTDLARFAAFKLDGLVQLRQRGGPPGGGGGHAVWWTKECQQTWVDWKLAKRDLHTDPDEALEEKHMFKAMVRKAKQQYWGNRIAGCQDRSKLWSVVAWHKYSARLNPPPIQHNGILIQDPVGKAEALWEAIGERFSSDDDLPEDPLEDWQDSDKDPRLAWSCEVTMEELEKATIGPKNTAPGIDRTTIGLMKKCWDILKSCSQDIMDGSSAGIISPLHAGALPRKSAMDLVASFTHDVELALNKNLSVSMVLMDVQGAFDALLRNRLLERMRRQGWPLELLRLVRSFLRDRRVRARLGKARTGFKEVLCGTPQGSPLSPVLYLLYLAELLTLDTQLRFGYADDVAMYRVGRTLQESSAALGDDIRKVLDWGAVNKVVFAPDKYELAHITRKRTTDNPSIDLGSQVIDPIPLRYEADPDNPDAKRRTPALRWLGVWIDRKFTFRRHVEEKCTSALKVVNHLRGLSNTIRGMSPGVVRQAVMACVLPTALYGAEAWYGGRLKPAANGSAAGKDHVSARLGGHIDDIQKVLNAAARAILPVWRTTPNGLLCREAAIPTAEMALEECRLRFSVRLRKSAAGHPLASRADAPVFTRRKTRLQVATETLPKVERLVSALPRYPQGSNTDPTGGLSKSDAAKEFEAWYTALPRDDVVVFTDGSQNEKSQVGYGYAVYQNGKEIGCGQASLPDFPHSVVFDAEAVGAWRGLQHVLRLPPEQSQTRIWVCLDNTGAIWCHRGNASDTSQWAFLQLHGASEVFDIRVKWAPGHCGVEGNERADFLAKMGAREGPRDSRPGDTTVAGIRALARQQYRGFVENVWARQCRDLSKRYRDLSPIYRLREEDDHGLPRSVAHRLLAIKTGHGDFACLKRLKKVTVRVHHGYWMYAREEMVINKTKEERKRKDKNALLAV
ncbi:uncharacterized protein CPUR_08796 [Claviceps purpurea 20.1]|uniref:RNase H type-1 domain-containing protein n=1 Tax=Claviceps purpurea (strain 20.1) TaxID=1111077 RepID=M1VZD7_CLAP2|nr:uncharacterized protein CPUR_08796 [Claviceps purpurea 20.1]